MLTAEKRINPPAESPNRPALNLVASIYREFLSKINGITPVVPRPILKEDEDTCGTDFAFSLEVEEAEYDRVLRATSELTARFYVQYGVNFIVIPEVV